MMRAIASFMFIGFACAAVLAGLVLLWQYAAGLYLLLIVAAVWYAAVKWGHKRIF